MQVRYPYHVRVLVPCYKESLEILRRTIMAAYDAQLPEGCHRTIYLCDDGKDPKKRKWVDSLAADVVYVSGRKRPSGNFAYLWTDFRHRFATSCLLCCAVFDVAVFNLYSGLSVSWQVMTC